MRASVQSTYLAGRRKLRNAEEAIRRCLDHWGMDNIDRDGYPKYCSDQVNLALVAIKEFDSLAAIEKGQKIVGETPFHAYFIE